MIAGCAFHCTGKVGTVGHGNTGRGGAGPGSGPGSTTTGQAGDGQGSTGGSTSTTSTTGGSGGAPPVFDAGPPPACDAGWPSGAPALMPGQWTQINPKGPVFSGHMEDVFSQGMAFDPCNPATIYLCTSSFNASTGGLWRTVDAGANWTKIGKLDEPVRVRVDPRNSLHLYVGDGVRGATLGFWVSMDGGSNWTKPPSLAKLGMFVDDVYDVATDPADFKHVLVTSHSPWNLSMSEAGAGVLESRDGGDSWIVHPPSNNTWGQGHNIWFLKTSGSWLLGTQSAGYWRTTDFGATWAQVTKENMAHGGGQLYKTKGGLYFAAAVNGVLKSTDDGVTWTISSGNPKYTTAVYGDGNLLYTHQAYAGPADTFYSSPETDGMTWTPFGSLKTDQGPFEMAFDAQNRILYSASWGAGIFALKVP
jgi:photosystem II stability/assembly factor-like uncharacterized protein